jgi:hypothetical protein
VQFVRGNIKVQHGIYRIFEMLEIPASAADLLPIPVAGYAIFDLKDQRMSKIFSSFQIAVSEIDRLTQG